LNLQTYKSRLLNLNSYHIFNNIKAVQQMCTKYRDNEPHMFLWLITMCIGFPHPSRIEKYLICHNLILRDRVIMCLFRNVNASLGLPDGLHLYSAHITLLAKCLLFHFKINSVRIYAQGILLRVLWCLVLVYQERLCYFIF